jgi:altronate dehydratase small subunit
VLGEDPHLQDEPLMPDTPKRAFQVHASDNVATLIDDARPGEPIDVLGPADARVASLDTIAIGHKVAVADIDAGSAVTKFGVPIGQASATIRRGAWVHLHNVTSNFDERSQTLDVHSGATTDTKYE